MRPIVNVPEEDRVTDVGNTHKKTGKNRACGSGDILADRQTDALITRSNKEIEDSRLRPAGHTIAHESNNSNVNAKHSPHSVDNERAHCWRPLANEIKLRR